MSSSFVLNQNALQISQSLTAAYSGLVVAGTGLVRLTGEQNITGKKTFQGAVDFVGSPINLTGVSSFVPFSNASTDIGSASRIFKTGFFSGVTGFTGYFQNLTVGILNTSLVPSLVNVTGNNMTLSGTTNIDTANISGNLGLTGTLLVRGASTLSGNTSFLGTVYATGNKTFSGVFNQSGDVNIYGKTLVSGDSSFTGNINITGDTFLKGNHNIIGKFIHTGQHFVDSNNNSITFTGDGPSHAFRVFSPMHLYGTINHSGGAFININSFVNSGSFTNTGSFSNLGNFNLWGDVTINTGTSINFNTNPKFNSGISCSGNSTAPSLRINPNLVSSPSGGAIEYSRGQFVATNELTGAPTRALINQTYSCIVANSFVFPFMTGGAGIGTPYMFFGTTGIYLSTGVYDITYNFSIRRGAGTPIFSFGLTGDGTQNFNYRHGLLTQINTAALVDNVNITGSSLNPSLAISGIGAATAATTTTKFELNAVINITGSRMKIRPFMHSATNSGNITGINFDMRVTTLSTGSGINQNDFNGPWSDS